MINLILGFVCLWAITDSWKRNLFLWSVIWLFVLVFDIYIWTLLP